MSHPNSSAETLLDLFENPSRDFSPTPLWWWSAETVTDDEIRRQLEKMHEGGIYNVVVINLAPSGPLFGAVVDDPIWFSEQWFERFAEVCSTAARLGMRVWFYDQLGFSGANIQGKLTQQNPWAAGKSLRLAEVTVEPGGATAIEVDRLVGAYSMPTDDAPHGRRLTVADDGRVSAQEGETIRVISWRPTAFDYLNVDAVELLIDLVHGEFERRMPELLGNVIMGSFQDELPATNSWTSDFADSFRSAFGYDLLDVLPAVFEPNGVEGAKILHDYFEHRSTRTEAALFEPLGSWHDKHGMLLGSDQLNPARAGWPTQATQLYSDYFRTHRHYSAAGSDHEGDSKVHSSMAHLYGNDRVWIESFHSSGWGGTLQDTYDWLLPFLRSGANLYNPHAIYYGTVSGWFEWAPPSTDWRQPYWGQHKAFADCVARIASLMSWGEHSCSVAVLYPSATSKSSLPLNSHVDHFSTGLIGIADADEAQARFLDLAGSNNWWKTNPGALNEAAIDFDVIDDSSVQSADVVGDALGVRAERYRAVLVPGARVLEAGTAARLIELLDAGGRVILLSTVPEWTAGTAGDDTVIARLVAHPKLEQYATAGEAVAALGTSYRALDGDLASLVRTDGAGTSIAFVPAAQPNASAYPLRTGDDWFWEDFDFDPSRYAGVSVVTVPDDVAWAQSWNPATGLREQLALTRHDGRSRIAIPFNGSPGLLLVWGTGEAPAGARLPESTTASEALQLQEWSTEIIPTLDNAHGEFDRPARPGYIDQAIWKVEAGEAIAGQAPQDWSSTRATFGVKGELAEPVAAGQEHDFQPWAYSDSRGIEKDDTHRGLLGVKGRVPDAFVTSAAAYDGATSRYRAFVRLPAAGRYDLIVSASATKKVWLDGILVGDDTAAADAGFQLRIPVDAAFDVVLLEYELGDALGGGTFMAPSKPVHQGSSFAFTSPGDWPLYPDFMIASDRSARAESRQVTFSRTVDVREGVQLARIVTGAATALAVLVDGVSVGRQEMAEYYESDWGAAPQFFVHDLTATFAPGSHLVEVVCDTADPAVLLSVDLVVRYVDGSIDAVVSGFGWDATVNGAASPTVPTRHAWGESANAQLARRPHPLPRAQWLSGDPEIGTSAIRVDATDSLEEREQWLRLQLPAGVTSLEVPTALGVTLSIGGVPLPTTQTPDGVRAELATATAVPSELLIVTEPTAFSRGGAVLEGPVRLTCVAAPAELKPWAQLGLDWLSGGLRYTHSIQLDTVPQSALLDLGEVRGHVRLVINGHRAADLFCTPWSWQIADYLHEGVNTVEVEVFNTLGPYLDDTTPTWWVFPSQKLDGLFGPVTLHLDRSEG